MLTWWSNTQTTHGLRGWPILFYLRLYSGKPVNLCQLSHVNNCIVNAHKNITLIYRTNTVKHCSELTQTVTMRIHFIAHIKRYKVNTQIPDYVLYKTLAIGDVRQSNFGQWQTSSLEVEWSSQKWTRAESVVLHHLDRPIPICADDDIIIRDDGVGRTVWRRRAVMQVAHPWSGGIPS